MAIYLQSNNITAEDIGVRVIVPNNDVARLMYYLQCVCTTIDCDNDPDIQSFTNYNNWSSLSIEDQKALVLICYTFSPDVFDNRVLFYSDELCRDSSNGFFKINQISNHIIAAESIAIGGQVRVVNKIMTYKREWMQKNYIDPMQRLVARLGAPPPSITYTSTPKRQRYAPPVIRQPVKQTKKCSGRCKCCSIFIVILIIIIGIGIGVFFLLKQRGVIKLNF